MSTSVTIAPHLYSALQVMSQDMAVETQALVNQAVFTWLRINGYAVNGPIPLHPQTAPKPVEESPPAPLASPPKSAPQPAFVAAPTPPSAPAVKIKVEVAAVQPPPTVEPAPPPPSPPPPAAPSPEARIAEIEVALQQLTKPWPPWSKPPQVEAPEESQEEDDDDAAAEEDVEDEDDAPQPASEDEASVAVQSVDESDDSSEKSVSDAGVEKSAVPDSTIIGSVASVLYLEQEGREPVRVDAERFIIGRGLRCDFIIDSPQVSREHAVLTRAGIGFVLEDLNSSNGTWFQDERLTRRELEDGDVIFFGNERFVVVLRNP